MAQRPLGIDVSDYQGSSINWTSVKNSGVVFAWTKSTQGAAGQYSSQASFTINENGAKAAGIYMGAYHFAQPNINAPSSEASYFWSVAGNYIKADGKTLMPMLDMEVFTGVVGASSYSDWVNQWCNIIAADGLSQGVIKPCIYFSAGKDTYFDSSISQWYSDIANYGSVNGSNNPQTGTPWSCCASADPWGSSIWHCWQYDSVGAVPGISGNVDQDVYIGALTNLVATLVLGGTPPTITGNPASTTIWAGSNVTFTAGASSVVAASYIWKFNGTNISGATTTSYAVTNAQLTNAGGYSFQATNIYGVTNSTTAYLGVLGPLTNASNSIVSPSGLVDWWPADGNAYDIFGTNNNNGIPAGTLTYATGEVGKAFHFDGSTSSLTLASNVNLAVPWTVCMWINRESTPQTSAALISDGTNSIKLEQNPNTHQLGVTQVGVADNVFSPAVIVPTGTWTHLAFVGTSTNTTAYTNGVLAGVVTNSFRLPGHYLGATWFPSPGKFADFMQGGMDEVMIFNRALSSGEIGAVYSAGTAGLIEATQITGTALNTNRQFILTIRGQTGKSFNVEYSSDLATWFSIGSIPNTNGTATVTDGNASHIAKRYFRASQSY